MKSYWERKEEQRREWKKHSNTPANSRLKIVAISSLVLAAACMVAALIVTINDTDDNYFTLLLILRCMAGIFALLGMILYMTLYYRVSKSSLQSRWTNKSTD